MFYIERPLRYIDVIYVEDSTIFSRVLELFNFLVVRD